MNESEEKAGNIDFTGLWKALVKGYRLNRVGLLGFQEIQLAVFGDSEWKVLISDNSEVLTFFSDWGMVSAFRSTVRDIKYGTEHIDICLKTDSILRLFVEV